jgi:RNA polymerase sigma-70 factor, ECF subfamily
MMKIGVGVEQSMDRPPEMEPDERTDQELIALVNAGDASAFEALYLRYKDWVVQLAFRFTGDRELALDVLQETFLYFLKKFPGFVLTARLQTFLYPAVRNLSIAARRKAERLQSNEIVLQEAPAPEAAQEDPRAELSAALADLSEAHREVLLLRFVDGLSLGEIAEAMEVPLGTVKSRLHKALEILREDERAKNYFSP